MTADPAAAGRKRWLFLTGLVLVYIVAFVAARGLDFELRKDELHFWDTSLTFSEGFPPSLEQLRGYAELITPLCFVLWGQLERITGDGVFFGRFLNLLISFAILCWIGLRRSADADRSMLSAIGLLTFPYFIVLSLHLYTDVIGAALVFLGFHLHLRGRPWWGALCFGLAVATRQYMLVAPMTLAVWEAVGCWRASRVRASFLLAPVVSAASLLGWIVLFGGLAPQAGLEYWIPKYEAPMLSLFALIPEHGLYFLTALGAYFVAVEFVLFRRWSELPHRLDRSQVMALAALAGLFLIFPPLIGDEPTTMGGPLNRVAMVVIPIEWLRMGLYYLLAAAAVLRFMRDGLSSWVVLAFFVLMMKTQLPWEKYALPPLVLLWYLKSLGADLRPAAEGYSEQEAR